MTEVLTMIALGAACWVLRIFFVVVVPAERIPSVLHRALQYLASAVLAAIAAVEVTSVLSSADLVGSGLAVAAMVLVGVVAFRWRNSAVTMIVAIVAIFVLDLILL